MKLRNIVLFAFAATAFIACKNEKSLRDKAEKYVRDSVLTSFNDPKSFEFVSFGFDTIYSHSMIKSKIEELQDELKKKENDVTSNKIEMQLADKDDIKSYKKIDSLNNSTISILKQSLSDYTNQLSKPDSINHINTNISYRAKNKMGALILENMFLLYHPENNSFEVVSLQDK